MEDPGANKTDDWERYRIKMIICEEYKHRMIIDFYEAQRTLNVYA